MRQSSILANLRSTWTLAVLGCGLVSSSSLSVSVEVLSEGPTPPAFTPSTAQAPTQLVVIEAQQGFDDPGFRIHATARVGATTRSDLPDTLRVEVETERLAGDFVPISWARSYRFQVQAVPSGTYRVQLHWQNNYLALEARSRILVDTVLVVP